MKRRYFGGWDGRSRMSGIDTKKCPVYMLTGEYVALGSRCFMQG